MAAETVCQVISLLLMLRWSGADFTIAQHKSSSNSTGIYVCVRLEHPPGTLSRDGILAFSNLQDHNCVFDNYYSNDNPGNGLDPSRAYSYSLKDSFGNTTGNVLCTYPREPYKVSALMINDNEVALELTINIGTISPLSVAIGVLEDSSDAFFFEDNVTEGNGEYTATMSITKLFTNRTYFVASYHFCPHMDQQADRQESEKIMANTVRSGLTGVNLAKHSSWQSWVKLSITAQDKDWSLDYILYRNNLETQIANFTYPVYYGNDSIWTDTGLNVSTFYVYRIFQQDRLSGLHKESSSVIACTHPATPERVDYTINLDTMKATITWVVPTDASNLEIFVEVTTGSNDIQLTNTSDSSPFTWPEALSIEENYVFYVRFYIKCEQSNNQYSPWSSVSVRARTPILTAMQTDETMVSVDVNRYQQYNDLRLFVDGNEYLPSPNSYPHNITGLKQGQTYTFHIQAHQFGESIRSAGVDFTLKGADADSSTSIIGTVVGSVGAGMVLLFLVILIVLAILWSRRFNEKAPTPTSVYSHYGGTENARVNVAIVAPRGKCGSYVNKNLDVHKEQDIKHCDTLCSTEYKKSWTSNYPDPYASSQPKSRSRTINLRNYVRDSTGTLVTESVLMNEYRECLSNGKQPSP